MKDITFEFRLYIVGLAFLHFVLSYFVEVRLANILLQTGITTFFFCSFTFQSFLIDYLIFNKLKSSKLYQSIFISKLKYQKIFDETQNLVDWLPSRTVSEMKIFKSAICMKKDKMIF